MRKTSRRPGYGSVRGGGPCRADPDAAYPDDVAGIHLWRSAAHDSRRRRCRNAAVARHCSLCRNDWGHSIRTAIHADVLRFRWRASRPSDWNMALDSWSKNLSFACGCTSVRDARGPLPGVREALILLRGQGDRSDFQPYGPFWKPRAISSRLVFDE